MIKYLLFVVLILVWSPFQILAYGAPVILLGYLLVSNYQKTVASRLLAIVAVFMGYVILGYIIYSEYSLVNSAIYLLTFSSIIFLISSPSIFSFKLLNSKRAYNFIYKLAALEIALGFIQIGYIVISKGSFDLSAGDVVEGTAHIPLGNGGGIETQMFFSNVLFMCLYMIYIYTRTSERKYLFLSLLGFVIVLLSSVIHMAAMFIVAAGIAYGLIFLNKKLIIKYKYLIFSSFFTLLFLAILAFNLQTSNIKRIPQWLSRFSNLETPKTLIVKRYAENIVREEPMAALVGLGPGQFSSRASLYRSGTYSDFELLGTYKSDYFESYLGDFISHIQKIDWSSSSMFPYYSWITIISELGLVIFTLCIIWLTYLVFEISYIIRNRKKDRALIGFMAVSGALFLFFIGFQDNYWEMPHVMLFPIIFLKYCYYIIKSEKRIKKLKFIRVNVGE